MNGCGFGGCWWIIILILIFCVWLRRLRNGCGGCGNGCGGCGCDNGCGGCGCWSDGEIKERRSITLRRFFYLSSFSKRFSRRFTIVFSAFMRAYFFIVALKYRPWCYICGGKCYHAVNIFLIGVPLFTVAPILIGYFQRFSGVFSRSLKRRSCSSLSTLTQNFIISALQSWSWLSNSFISR